MSFPHTYSSEANVSEAEEKVTSRASRLQARFDLGLTFMARGATYRSIEDRAIVAPLILECGLGAFNTSNMCCEYKECIVHCNSHKILNAIFWIFLVANECVTCLKKYAKYISNFMYA